MENSANKNSEMKLQVFLDFDFYGTSLGNGQMEVDLPFIPRVGEWFNAEKFLSDEEQDDYGYAGVFYVRHIRHSFDIKENVQRVFICLDESDTEYYEKHYEGR